MGACWTVLDLSPDDYDNWWTILAADLSLKGYVIDKVRLVVLLSVPALSSGSQPSFHRYDWSPHDSTLTVRMPSSIHDIFTELVVEEIKSQLTSASQGKEDSAATILSQIGSETTSDIYLYGFDAVSGKFPKRSPDASLAHADAQYPSIVIETSYSQTQKNLAHLADDYVCGSDGNIAVVLGFDIQYGVQSKRAALSVWRPRTVKDEEGAEEARILETVSDREADVRLSDPFLTKHNTLLICSLSSLSDLMTGPQSSIAAFAFGSAILH
jgi:hypothetical protein